MASDGNVKYSAVNTTQPKEETPPPYNEVKQDVPPPPTYNPTASTKPFVEQQPPPQQQSNTEPTQKPPPRNQQKHEATPSGSGVLGTPFKRILYIGLVLILYYLLSFWMPVYWMSGAANYCKFVCNTYPATLTWTVNDISFQGCYESVDAACDDVCIQTCEKYSDDVVDGVYEAMYVASSRTMRLAAWTLIVVGMASGFIGCILGIIGSKKNNKLSIQISFGMIGLGGIMIIVGALLFVSSWDIKDPTHLLSQTEDVLNVMRAIIFIEYTLPATIAILLAIDIYKPSIFNNENVRMLTFSVPFAVISIMGGILWAFVVNYEYLGFEFSELEELYDGGGCIAAGFFIVGLMFIARILIWGQYVTISENESNVITAKCIIAIVLGIGVLVLCAGYWAFIDALFKCEYDYITDATTCPYIAILKYMTSDSVGPLTVMKTVYDVTYEGQFKSYYVGFTLFIIGMIGINLYDMDCIQNCKKLNQSSSSQINEGGGSGGVEITNNNEELNKLKNVETR